MATNVPSSVCDISSQIIPLQMKIREKIAKFLIRGKDVKYLSDHLKEVTQDLTSMLPGDLPEDPVYICFVNGKVHIPEVVLRNLNSKDQTHPRIEHEENPETVEENNTEDTTPANFDLEDSSETEKSRYEWRFSDTKELLTVLKARKERKENFTKNMWNGVAKELKEAMKSKKIPSPEQCREKFYSLRRSYRNYIAEKKKTGNKRIKPFLHESEMYDLLHDDPGFNPPLLMSSLGAVETNNSEENSCTEKDPPKKRKCSNELTEYLKERDEKFLNAFKEMHENQNKIMEKLIEKL